MLMMTAAPEQCTHQSILEVTGSLRMPVSDGLRQRVQALLACGERRILLDVSRLTHIDAAGVGELVHAFNITSAAGGVLQIAHAGGRVRRLLHLSGLLTLLTADHVHASRRGRPL